jgi:hypothetical protein
MAYIAELLTRVHEVVVHSIERGTQLVQVVAVDRSRGERGRMLK